MSMVLAVAFSATGEVARLVVAYLEMLITKPE
jgi:hypothetical protein